MFNSPKFKSGKPIWPLIAGIALLVGFGILALLLWTNSSGVPLVGSCSSTAKNDGRRQLTLYLTNQSSVTIDLGPVFILRPIFGATSGLTPRVPVPTRVLEPGKSQVVRFVIRSDAEAVELEWEKHSRLGLFLKKHLRSFPKIGSMLQPEHTLSIPVKPA